MILLINGASSVGKSCVCAELHQHLSGWIYFETDSYLSMLGKDFINLNKDTVKRLSKTIPQAISLISAQNFHIIYDAHIPEAEEFEIETSQLGADVFSVYLEASEETLKQRERLRSDRPNGTALKSLRRFTSAKQHNLIINTNTCTPKDVAMQIINQANIK